KDRLLKLELKYNYERLNKSVLSIERKKEFAEELMDRISEMNELSSSNKNSLKFFVLNELEIDESILIEEKNVSTIGQAHIAQLKLSHPQLTENDIHLLGYIKMKLTNKQIAEIKNVEVESVKTAKNRLRKKLNLEAADDFSELLSD